MGQYHVLVNFTKKERVIPHKIGLGAKQVEHAQTVASLPDALYMLLTASPARGGGDLDTRGETPDFKVFGRWCGDIVAVVGDYTEEEDIPGYPDAAAYDDDERTTDITDQIIPAFERAFGVRITSKSGWRDRKLTDEWEWLIGKPRTDEAWWQSSIVALINMTAKSMKRVTDPAKRAHYADALNGLLSLAANQDFPDVLRAANLALVDYKATTVINTLPTNEG